MSTDNRTVQNDLNDNAGMISSNNAFAESLKSHAFAT